MKTTLRKTESVWKDSHSGGFVAEIRGLADENGIHEWVKIGVFGSREEAMKAILKTRR